MSPAACLGAILLLTVILIAFFAWRYRKTKLSARSRFSYATPATPRVREAVGDLFAGLRRMVALGQDFEDRASRVGNAVPVAGARLSAGQMVSIFSRTEKALSGAPPTYANYLAVYRGLTSTDAALLDAADAYTNAGRQVHQAIARSALGDAALTPDSGDAAELGNSLIAMGRQVRQVVSTVHRLGVALDVE